MEETAVECPGYGMIFDTPSRSNKAECDNCENIFVVNGYGADLSFLADQ